MNGKRPQKKENNLKQFALMSLPCYRLKASATECNVHCVLLAHLKEEKQKKQNCNVTT